MSDDRKSLGDKLYLLRNHMSACLLLPDVEGLSPVCAIRICGQEVRQETFAQQLAWPE
jgi:hypothetical protein